MTAAHPVPTDEPKASIVLATRDRAEHLSVAIPLLLDAIAATDIPSELVVVDNGSSDGTPKLLAAFAEQHNEFVALREDAPGKSRAITHALGRVRGDVVLFTDDDVRVPPSWVSDLAEPVLAGRADVVAGRVKLADYLDRSWLAREMRTALAEFLDVSGEGMVGGNVAVATAAVRAVGFDEKLGTGAHGYAEDVLFGLQLKANGYRIIGSWGPPVIHHVDVSRLQYRYMAQLAERNGYSHAYLWHHWLHSDLRFVRTRLLRDRARLLQERGTHRQDRNSEGIRLAEYELIYRTTFFRQLLVERKQPPQYSGERRSAAAIVPA
jgi:glucosyl-dolichyl phosphate glucuronosyltransferase